MTNNPLVFAVFAARVREVLSLPGYSEKVTAERRPATKTRPDRDVLTHQFTIPRRASNVRAALRRLRLQVTP